MSYYKITTKALRLCILSIVLTMIAAACNESSGKEDLSALGYIPSEYSEDVLIDDIRVHSNSFVCARYLGGKVICNAYGGVPPNFLMETPDVACDANSSNSCYGDMTSGFRLTSAVWRDQASSINESYKVCAIPKDGMGLLCWGGDRYAAPGTSFFENLPCPDGSCDAMCKNVDGEDACWGQWLFQDKEVLSFDGYCAQFSDGEVSCFVSSALDALVQSLIESHGPVRQVRANVVSACVLSSTGSVYCKNENGNLYGLEADSSGGFSEFVNQGESVCASRENGEGVVCAGSHIFLLDDGIQPDSIWNQCHADLSQCPHYKTDEHLTNLSINNASLCGLNARNKAVCYYPEGSRLLESDADVFGYMDRTDDDGNLLREQVECINNKCTSAEHYSMFELSPEVGKGADNSYYHRDWAGCGVTLNDRPHCFGMFVYGNPACSWGDTDDCRGRVF